MMKRNGSQLLPTRIAQQSNQVERYDSCTSNEKSGRRVVQLTTV